MKQGRIKQDAIKIGSVPVWCLALLCIVLVMSLAGCHKASSRGSVTDGGSETTVKKLSFEERNRRRVPEVPIGQTTLEPKTYMAGCQALCSEKKADSAKGSRDAVFCDHYCACSYKSLSNKKVSVDDLRAYIRHENTTATARVEDLVAQCVDTAKTSRVKSRKGISKASHR